MSEYATRRYLNEMERKREMNIDTSKLKPLAEIKAALEAPIPDDWYNTKKLDKQGNVAIFVPYIKAMERLDEATGGAWDSNVTIWPQIIDPPKNQVTVPITIHTKEGSFTKTGTGIEPIGGNSYGDELSNPFAQAFNRAMQQWGFQRLLWDDAGYAELEARLMALDSGADEDYKEPINVFPKSTGNGNGKPMTDPQHKLIERLAKKIDPKNFLTLIKQTLKNAGVKDNIPATSSQASAAIDTLQVMQDGK